MLDGLMMEWPLTLTPLLERARRIYAGQQIATRTASGVRRTSFAESVDRIERLASALSRLGVRPGERVATMAWNSQGHFEAYLGVPSMGAVLHTVNFRLFHDQMVHVMNHAEDRVVLVDASVYPVLEKVRPRLKTVREVVVLDDVGQGVPPGTLDFEELVRGGEPGFQWPALEERAAAVMCYTSGTTGHPKGCVYTHRALVLHTLGMGCSGLGLSDADTALVIVPMFHANAWGMPFAALMFGVNQVFPGRFMQPADLAALIESERATYVAGVPTIVAGVLMALRQQPRDVSSLRLVTVGGSALPESLLDGLESFGINVVQGWGMTELSPIGSLAVLKGRLKDAPIEEQRRVRLSQGLPLPCVEIRIVDDAGRALAWDGEAAGELQVRGPWVISAYYDDPRNAESFQDGWFRTGDVAAISPEGYIQLVDRAKDVIKSGGEWVSSVDLENAIMGHPSVAEATVIGVAHPKWMERPLACVVPRDPSLTRDQVTGFLKGKIADWWIPDDVVFLSEIPKTSVGKFDKKVLRDRFKDHQWPTTND